MAVRQRQVQTPYSPLPVGDLAGDVDLASVEQELSRISAAMQRLYSGGASPSELAALVGVPDSFTLGPAPEILVNYGAKFKSSTFLGQVDDSLGVITVLAPALIRITASAQGDQGNNSFNEAAFMFLRRVDGGGSVDLDLAGYEIPNNKTTSRSWNASRLISVVDAPATFSLGLRATSGLGSFTFTQASFDIAGYQVDVKE